MDRCKWVNMHNDKYIKYHDEEWGKAIYEDNKIYEIFVLELFQAGLSWECILNKRENFRRALDNFNISKIITYDEEKINELLEDKSIIRNKLKIKACINNSKLFKEIQREYGSFSKYIWSFTDNNVIYEECDKITRSDISDRISKDLKKRGMSFVGSVTIYSFLQAIGIVNGHTKNCFLYKK